MANVKTVRVVAMLPLEQHVALRRIALANLERGTGPTNTSAVLREILEQYLAWEQRQASAGAAE